MIRCPCNCHWPLRFLDVDSHVDSEIRQLASEWLPLRYHGSVSERLGCVYGDAFYSECRHDVAGSDCDAIYSESRHDVADCDAIDLVLVLV